MENETRKFGVTSYRAARDRLFMLGFQAVCLGQGRTERRLPLLLLELLRDAADQGLREELKGTFHSEAQIRNARKPFGWNLCRNKSNADFSNQSTSNNLNV